MWSRQFKIRFGEVELYFGPGVLRDNSKQALQGSKKAVIVSSKSAAKISGAFDDIVSVLNTLGIEYTVFNKVTPNPTTGIVNELVELIEGYNADTIIAIGGGSVIDTAKVASILPYTGVKAEEYVYGKRPQGSKLKLIAVNLTHGTGSEVDRFAVLTVSGTIEKRGFITRYPDISFDDSYYTLTLSREQTLYTTLDAFYHAYEAATSKRNNIFVLTLAEEAVEKVTSYLEKTLSEPRNLEARTNLLYASMLAGMCIDTSGTHLVHALEHGFSGLNPDLPHGAGLAIVGPYAAYYIHKAVPEESARILRILDPSIKPVSEDAEKAVKIIQEFQRKHGFEQRLSDYGIREVDLEKVVEFVEKTIRERYSVNLPLNIDKSTLLEIARRAL